MRRTSGWWLGAVAAATLVGALCVPTDPLRAADRAGNPGRGTGWLVTDAGRVDAAPFWAGTHVIDDGREGLCLEFAHRGPLERTDHGYGLVPTPSGLTAADVRLLGYVMAVVGSSGADSADRRDRAAAGAYAVWAIAEAAGQPTSSSQGVPGGSWSSSWGGGLSSGSPARLADDPAMEPDRVRRYHELLRSAAAPMRAEGEWDVRWEGDLERPDGQLAVMVTRAGHPVPLVPVEVVDASGPVGVEVGSRLETDVEGRARLPLLGGPDEALSLEVVAWLPGAPAFAATPELIDGVSAQTMVLEGEPEPVPLRWRHTPSTTTTSTTPSTTTTPSTSTTPSTTTVSTTTTTSSTTSTTVAPTTSAVVTTTTEAVPSTPTSTTTSTVVPTTEIAPTSSSTTVAAVVGLPPAGGRPVGRPSALALGVCLLGAGLVLQARRSDQPAPNRRSPASPRPGTMKARSFRC